MKLASIQPELKSSHLSFVTAVCVLTVMFCTGCVTELPWKTESPTPVQNNRTYANSYDRVWRVVTTTIQSEGFNLNVLDKESGVANGLKPLVPGTFDMLMNYSVRILVNITVQRVGGNNVEVRIQSIEERKHEEHGWRPGRNADSYSEALFEQINKQLNVRAVAGSGISDGSRRNVKTSGAVNTQDSRKAPERAQVQKMQAMLNALGYSVGVVDGVMGSRTAGALGAFQHDQGLEVTGTINAQTLGALNKAITDQ